MQWACVLLPQLAMDGVLRRRDVAVHGAAEDAAIALVEGPMQRRTLHSVTPAARALGLKPGLSLAAAQALSTKFEAIPYDADDVERWRALLAAWAYRFSSQVSTDLPHALLLEVGHSLRLFGPWPRLEARLREELHALGFRHRIVAAPNPHAARVLANVHDGLAVDEHALRNALGQLPLERSGLPQQVAFSLTRMGVRKLRQVFALPRDAIARRFPKSVLEHLDAIRGDLVAPLQCYEPPQHFEGRIEFESEVESSQALLFPLRRLSQDLAAFLAGRDGGVQRYTLVLEHERCADSEVRVGLLTPQREANMLFELGRGRLEQARLPAPVRGFRLVARELPPFVPAARDLFETRAQQDVPWPQLRERLRARLGDEAVHGIGHSPEHRPERVSMTGKPSPDARLRPGWLLPHVVPLRDHALRVVAGPERIESGWWDGGDVRRDYYVVETSLGQRAWAFCAAGEPVDVGPAPSHFMLHGWFA
jgi:protein ImuB